MNKELWRRYCERTIYYGDTYKDIDLLENVAKQLDENIKEIESDLTDLYYQTVKKREEAEAYQQLYSHLREVKKNKKVGKAKLTRLRKKVERSNVEELILFLEEGIIS